ncbi:hypothetical protein MRX96_013919 [Rhipicephalus microplus]
MPWTGGESAASTDEDNFWVEEEYVPPPQTVYNSRPSYNHDRRSGRSQTCREGCRQLSSGMNNWRQGPDKDTELMVVPAKEIGRIIGKGGSKIRELQDASGARIKVLRDEEEAYGSSNEAKIELAGTAEVRRKAQQLIEDLIYPQGTGRLDLREFKMNGKILLSCPSSYVFAACFGANIFVIEVFGGELRQSM